MQRISRFFFLLIHDMLARLSETYHRKVAWRRQPSLRVTPKKLFEDMDKYIEATKDLKLIL